MTPCFAAILFLGLSSPATALNFTQVFEWKELDYEWPSEARRTQALTDKTFKPENIILSHLAIYGTRLFLSLEKLNGIPATLVSLSTSSESYEPPKMTPFPSWEMHGYEDCNKIERARGLEMDSVGRLWVLDSGTKNCNSKLWIFDLSNNDQTKLFHQFSFSSRMYDLVLDETTNRTLAYITRGFEENLVVFSLDIKGTKKSWIVLTLGIKVLSVALSPKKERRKLYLGKHHSTELYSIPVAGDLRSGIRTLNPELIGKWNQVNAYRMLMDNHGTLYAAIWGETYTSFWKTSQPFWEQCFYEDDGLEISGVYKFTFALDQNGTLWMMVFDEKRQPKHKLLKAAVSGGEAQSRKLIDSSVFVVFLFAMAIS
ncbi:major royal jelly protein 2-like [Cloeon dipterum]|uniref:major royal jelly protein 2-like n=1 Tax=Cloeon dipterum TaxID=197152 RepID=UPI00321FB433